MSESKIVILISFGIIFSFFIGGSIGYLISNLNEDNNDNENGLVSPMARIQFNVNVKKWEVTPKTYLSEKLTDYFFIKDDIVTFYGDDSIDSDGMIYYYIWYFSENQITEHGRIVERKFTKTGTHWVNLTVVDNDNI